MFILLFPMGMGIMAGMFGVRLMMRAVSDQRMVWRFYKTIRKWMKGGGAEEKWNEEALGLLPIKPLAKKGLAIGLAAGVFMDVIAYVSAEPLVRLSQSVGGAAGELSYQNGSLPFQVALSLWGHGSLADGTIAFAGLMVGTMIFVCGVFVRMKVSANLDKACTELYRIAYKEP